MPQKYASFATNSNEFGKDTVLVLKNNGDTNMMSAEWAFVPSASEVKE